MAQLVPVGEGSPAVGKEFKTSEEVPVNVSTYSRITALEPGRRIAWDSWDGRLMEVKWAFELSPKTGSLQGDSTHLVQRAQFEPNNLVGRILLSALRRRQVPKENAQSLEKIKAVLDRR